jgi:hypothetical protein
VRTGIGWARFQTRAISVASAQQSAGPQQSQSFRCPAALSLRRASHTQAGQRQVSLQQAHAALVARALTSSAPELTPTTTMAADAITPKTFLRFIETSSQQIDQKLDPRPGARCARSTLSAHGGTGDDAPSRATIGTVIRAPAGDVDRLVAIRGVKPRATTTMRVRRALSDQESGSSQIHRRRKLRRSAQGRDDPRDPRGMEGVEDRAEHGERPRGALFKLGGSRPWLGGRWRARHANAASRARWVVDGDRAEILNLISRRYCHPLGSGVRWVAASALNRRGAGRPGRHLARRHRAGYEQARQAGDPRDRPEMTHPAIDH